MSGFDYFSATTREEAIDLLAQNAIPVSGVSTTSFRISLLVPRDQIENSVQLCHAHWVAHSGI